MASDPNYINASAGAPAYAANELRRNQGMFLTRAVTDPLGARSGVHPASGNIVTLAGTTITVGPHKATIYPATSTTSGPYVVGMLSEVHTLTAADGSNPRKDIVILRVYDHDEDSSGNRFARSEYIAGVPSATPAEPDTPLGTLRLATIDVPTGGVPSPTVTNNAPVTVAAGGVMPVRTDAELPAATAGLYDGMMRWKIDTDELQVFNGSATWETVSSTEIAQRGQMVCAVERTTTQAMINDIGSTATAVSWSGVLFDDINVWNVVAPTRLTPNRSGWYRFDAAIGWTANIAGTIRGGLWTLNGSAQGGVSRSLSAGGGFPNAEVTSVLRPFVAFIDAGAGDIVELLGIQNSGANLNLATGGNKTMAFVTYLRP